MPVRRYSGGWEGAGVAKGRYTEADKAAALAMLQANGGNVLRTACDLDIPEATLRLWKSQQKGDSPVAVAVAGKCEPIKDDLASLFERAVRVYVGHALDPDVVKKTSGKDAIVAAAVAAEKRQLLRGDPTEISDDRSRGSNERAAIVIAVLDGIRARVTGASVVPDHVVAGVPAPAPDGRRNDTGPLASEGAGQ
jgi:transposase-like protein